MYGSWFQPFTSSYTASARIPLRDLVQRTVVAHAAAALRRHVEVPHRVEMSTDAPGASGVARSTRSVVPKRVRFASRPPIVSDSSRGALLKP